MTDRLSRLLAMKFGPRTYTTEQAVFIEEVVRNRKPLPEEPLALDEERQDG